MSALLEWGFAPHVAPPLQVADFVAPVFVAASFVLVVSRLREPARQQLNAVLVSGAGAAYFSSGLGAWELAFAAVITTLAFFGLRSYRFIGVAWLLHSGWDVLHHFTADPIIVFAPTSSAGCAIADALIAVWFLLNAPPLLTSSR